MAGLPFELTRADITSFLHDVPNAASDVESHHKQATGNPELDWSFAGNIPRFGRAYQWGQHYILVSMDAAYRWRFVDITDMAAVQSIVANANNPAYFSPPGNVYSDVFNSIGSSAAALVNIPGNILEAVKKGLGDFGKNIQDEAHRAEYILLAVVLAAFVVIALAVWRVKAFDIPGLSVKGGA